MLDLKFFSILSLALCVFGDAKDIDLNPVIVGGNRARIEEAPFVAMYGALLKSKDPFEIKFTRCGASIVSKRFLLSAAHCYVGKEIEQSYVVVGTDNIGGGQTVNVEKAIPHPKYNKLNSDNDVLVLKLVRDLQYSNEVQAIAMADSRLVLKEGQYFDVFGFGNTDSGKPSSHLLRVKVPYIRPELCRRIHHARFSDRMICAGEPGKDSCEGDSGGPLVYGKVLIGVVSYGKECGEGYGSGVYASVAQFRDFIDSAIRSNS